MRQTGKITVQQAYEDEERQKSCFNKESKREEKIYRRKSSD